MNARVIPHPGIVIYSMLFGRNLCSWRLVFLAVREVPKEHQ
jgi:hypothetical protein